MLNFFAGCFALLLLLCFGIEGSLRKLDKWGKSAAAETQRVYCDLHQESCDYLARVRAELDTERVKRRNPSRKPLRWRNTEPKPALTEEQWQQLDKRGKSL